MLRTIFSSTIFFLIGVILVATAHSSFAQPPAERPPADAPNAPSPNSAAPKPGVDEKKPALFYFKDKNGELVPVPGWSLERLTELANATSAEAPRQEMPPAFTLRALTATGKAGLRFAELSLRIEIRTNVDGWTRVPLRLRDAVLNSKQPVRYDGPATQHLFSYDERAGEYVCFLRSKPNQRHELTLGIWASLKKVRGGSHVRLSMPRALLTRLILEVPVANLDVSHCDITSGQLDEIVARGGRSEIRAEGFSGDFTLSWNPQDPTAVKRTSTVDINGTLLAHVDGPSISTSALLSLRSRGGGHVQSFRVRLPRGATFVSSDQLGYDVETQPDENPSGQRRVVTVRLHEPAAAQVVRLVTEQTHDVAKPDMTVELVGFEVFDVRQPNDEPVATIRQSGYLATEVVGNWQVVRVSSQNVRQVAVTSLPNELEGADVGDAYEYLTQPSTLEARIIPLETRISVEPEYTFVVRGRSVEMAATFRYTIRGAPAFEVHIDATNWKIGNNGVGPPRRVNVQRLVFDRLDPLTIPLLESTTGDLELTLRGVREIPAETDTLSFSLPQPAANTLGPAKVTIFAADNVELLPLETSLSGMARLADATGAAGNPFLQEPLVYRGDANRATFIADFVVRGRQISLATVGHVEIDSNRGQVEQTFDYDVQYESIDELTFDVPSKLTSPDTLNVYLGREKLKPVVAPSDETDDDSTVRMSVPLPAPRLGLFQLKLRFEVPWDLLPPGASVPLDVPLVMPVDGDLSASRLRVSAAQGMSVQHVGDEPWELQDEAREHTGPDRPRELALQSSRRCGRIQIAARLESGQPFDSTIVQRAWLQTRFVNSARQDRVVFRLASSQPTVELILPPEVVREDEVFLDGKPTKPRVTADGISIELARNPGGRRTYVLEIGYHFPPDASRHRRLQVDPPRFSGAVWVQHAYWQLVLPGDEHLVSGSPGYSSESVWKRKGLFWSRGPLREQFQLESWSGATHREDFTRGTNRYLFSRMGSLESLEMRTARRSWIVLVASMSILIAGLIWLYVPRIRRGDVLFAVALCAAAASFLYPTPMLVVMQAASLGLGLVIVAIVLQRIVSRRQSAWPISSAATPVLDHSSTAVPHRSVIVGSHSSTDEAVFAGIPPSPDTTQ